jgi:acyl-CoA ligase (AMP-forming) (exosortase A-associated)
MTRLVHDLVLDAAARWPHQIAVRYQGHDLRYCELAEQALAVAHRLQALRLPRWGRVAIYAEKRPEVVATLLGVSIAAGAFVPVNPLLKPEQVAYILRDCDVHTLVTTQERLVQLAPVLVGCRALREIVVMAEEVRQTQVGTAACSPWPNAASVGTPAPRLPTVDADMAAILYTSGSTGQPKGVVLSHRNIVAGAESVSTYLEIVTEDRLLAVLPLSFDYGLNQVTSALHQGATVVLLNHLFPSDVVTAVRQERITGLAGVPPLWIQLAELPWPREVADSLRYITSSGGHMPEPTLRALQKRLPSTKAFLMYGLTEAFRSTYLPPEQLAARPNSIGRAIPNAEILVVRPDGSPCDDHEPGELVHRGVHVTMGYWNDPVRTRERYKPAPGQPPGLPLPELAVWSGDTVKRDAEGYLYFVGRCDDMIKTSGYRVSPHEVENVIAGIDGVVEVAAFGVAHPRRGQAVFAVVRAAAGVSPEQLLTICQQRLPSYMVPGHIEVQQEALPRNPNGKIDRARLGREHEARIAATDAS